MTTHGVTEQLPAAGAAGEDLSYDRSVDRSLVHKAAVSEVFVTQVVGVTPRKTVTAVQLPLVHAYYSDHLQQPAVYDALLLLEAGRQAAIAGTHGVIGFAKNLSMIVDGFSFRLPGLAALRIGAEPGRLVITTDYSGKADRKGRYRKGRVVQRYRVAGADVGEHAMDVLFLSHHQHGALRRAQRGTPAPFTTDLTPARQGGEPRPVSPASVGRTHPFNVVLSRPETEAGRISAEVTPDFGNRGLFEHVYDHLPAMTLVEAARQLVLLGSGRPRATHVAGIEARFSRFAELDEPIHASAPLPGPANPESPGTVPVSFRQGGAEIASVAITTRSQL